MLYVTLSEKSNRISNTEDSIEGTLARMDTLYVEVSGKKKENGLLVGKIVDYSELTLSNCIEEIEDRSNRKANIIMFNIPENSGSSNSDNLNYNFKIIKDILKVMSPDSIPTIKSVHHRFSLH